ncbi:virulence factor TspB C-terminal domain-related protein [Acinetobacter haemolyticus]|uniref:virulence factor TspB C-terminal domain-related protein n=1 Tax=Acinetobacter haemolyticus TaxID=29430 RepID=UPI000D6870DD|nr:virulence factor TspB C-terminal domain-related protein [Acinetobacter haemolyticus]
MRFLKYLVFIIITILPIFAFANTCREWTTYDVSFNDIGDTFNYWVSRQSGKTNFSITDIRYGNNGTTATVNYSYKFNTIPTIYNSSVVFNSLEVPCTCASSVTTKPISVPGWTEWDIDQIEAYHNKIADTTVCYDGCRFKNPSLSGEGGSDLMSLLYGDGTKDQSCPPSTDKPPTIPPDGYEPPKEPECKNSNGSDAHCPKPPQGCPSGYTEQTFNGESICVKDSDQIPNPNDPNNDDNQPPASEPNGGGDNNNGGGDVDLTPVINAINNLKTSLLNAISTVNQSITNGFKSVTDTLTKTNEKLDIANTKLEKSNQHLDNIHKESVKTNSKLDDVSQGISTTNTKLDTTNEHLKNIGDYTKAASEAIGESNKKLDGIKDAVEGAYGCANENYNPNDKNSNKYRECTEEDLEDGKPQDGKIDVIQREIETNFDGNIISVNDQCPPPLVIRFTLLQAHEISFDYDNFCAGAAISRPWVIFSGMLIAFLIVVGQYRGGSDA